MLGVLQSVSSEVKLKIGAIINDFKMSSHQKRSLRYVYVTYEIEMA